MIGCFEKHDFYFHFFQQLSLKLIAAQAVVRVGGGGERVKFEFTKSHQITNDGQFVFWKEFTLLLDQLGFGERLAVAPTVLIRRKLLEGVADSAPAKNKMKD